MADIFAYAIGIMYTPGPINLLGLSSGLNKQTRSHLGFFIGVGSAMFILFVLLGYLGLQVINPQFLPYVSLIGCGYILYIAWKVAKAKVQVSDTSADASLSFFRWPVYATFKSKSAGSYFANCYDSVPKRGYYRSCNRILVFYFSHPCLWCSYKLLASGLSAWQTSITAGCF